MPFHLYYKNCKLSDNLNLSELVNDLIETLVVTYYSNYTRFSQSHTTLERFAQFLHTKKYSTHIFHEHMEGKEIRKVIG